MKTNDVFPFDVRLSIEKELAPVNTLWTRAFYHQFRETRVPDSYYEYVRGEIDRNELARRHSAQACEADSRCLQFELGNSDENEEVVTDSINRATAEVDHWVLIGGPPCQAYSTIGRVKNQSLQHYNPDTDIRFELYREYLKIIGNHWPSIFVMENVRGLLSASHRQESIFGRMITDLRKPAEALELDGITASDSHQYSLYAVATDASFLNEGDEAPCPTDFIVKSEEYGIPQARHRVIILGVRDDIPAKPEPLSPGKSKVNACRVLNDLPRVRSGLSREDSPEGWIRAIKSIEEQQWWHQVDQPVRVRMQHVLESLTVPEENRGDVRFLNSPSTCEYRPDWFNDDRLSGTLNHNARSHRVDDLWRYLFAACFMEDSNHKFRISDFPPALRPRHRNIESALVNGTFTDRFSVQPQNAPSRTVVSHIRKDGHYYIHYDATQCRSLTVREAARLQTFPDNYLFEGSRTDQYGQVGNAVPPLLSRQIAERVAILLEEQEEHRDGQSVP
ncbi:MAG: DNA (cytosine-5-)-methyltransferase [Dehalococcoidia bacterium]|nr:DNA (cytosine-5-)-methyltransferase [Dehalococcoidia bacterium]